MERVRRDRSLTEAEQLGTEWASWNQRRDEIVTTMRDAGLSKNRIHTITGIARTTIDRILS